MRSPDRESGSSPARMAVIGSKGVGKTALTVRYLTRRFIGEYQSGTDIMYKSMLAIDGSKVALEILDLSSTADEIIIPRDTLTWAEAWLVVYSITSQESFRVASRAMAAVTAAFGCGIGEGVYPPVLLIANKKDLEHMRLVPENDGKRLAEKYGCKFVEVSAAEMTSQVSESVDGVLRLVSQHKGQTSPRLRKLSVSKMFNQFMNRSASNSLGSTATTGSNCSGSGQSNGIYLLSSMDKPTMPRVTFRDRAKKRVSKPS